MPTRSDAEEHLRIIRSLMEKATIYRAISAPTALVGGLASILVAALLHAKFASGAAADARALFLAGWLAVLAITAVANTWFLLRDARRRGDKFLSAGMRAAVRAFSPSYIVAALMTVLLAKETTFLPPVWMLFYGLGLLATQHFAPRSIGFLGWSFVAAGVFVGMFCSGPTVSVLPDSADKAEFIRHANVAMAATFGLFHLIYAACTWPRGAQRTAPGGTP